MEYTDTTIVAARLFEAQSLLDRLIGPHLHGRLNRLLDWDYILGYHGLAEEEFAEALRAVARMLPAGRAEVARLSTNKEKEEGR